MIKLRLLSLFLVLCAAVQARADDAATLAISGLDARSGASADQVATVIDTLTSTLVGDGRLRVVERAQMAKVMKEQALASSGVMSDEVQVKVGQLVGAKWILLGSLAGGRSYTLSLRALDTSSAHVAFADSTKVGSEDQLDDAARLLARKLEDKLLGTPGKSAQASSGPMGDFDPTQVKEASRQLARLLAMRFPRVEGKLTSVLPDGTAQCTVPDRKAVFKNQRFDVTAYDDVAEREMERGIFLVTNVSATGCGGKYKRTSGGEIVDGATIRSRPLRVGMDPLVVSPGSDPEMGKMLSLETRESLKNQAAFEVGENPDVNLVGRIGGARGHRVIEVQAMDKSGTVLQRWDLTGSF